MQNVRYCVLNVFKMDLFELLDILSLVNCKADPHKKLGEITIEAFNIYRKWPLLLKQRPNLA